MKQYVIGATVPLKAKYWLSGTLTACDTYVIYIEDPSGQLIIDGTTMSTSTTGIFTYDYDSSGSSALGVYKVDAVLTASGHIERPRFEFELIGAVE